MMRRLATAVIAAMLAAACVGGALGLAGCAGSASAEPFEGTWSCNLEQTAQGEGAKTPASAAGLPITLTVNQDGSASIGALGVEQDGKLTAKSADEATLEVEGAASEVKLDGDKLLLTHGGATMTFTKQ